MQKCQHCGAWVGAVNPLGRVMIKIRRMRAWLLDSDRWHRDMKGRWV